MVMKTGLEAIIEHLRAATTELQESNDAARHLLGLVKPEDIVIAYDTGPWPASLNWTAVTQDYDGAPDSRGARATAIGQGPTREAAIADLCEKLEEDSQ